MVCDLEYEIGITLAMMKPLPWYDIPWPMNHSFAPWAIRRKAGDATYKGFGFPLASWVWSVMSEGQMFNLLSVFPNYTDASVDIFIRTYTGQGFTSRVSTFTAKMLRPVDDNGRAVVPRTLYNYNSIVAKFEHLVEQ